MAMNRTIYILLWIVVSCELLIVNSSCSRPAQDSPFAAWQGAEPIANTPYFLCADTLRQGGLVLLHNLAIVDSDGYVLYADTLNDYEPDHCDLFPDGSIRLMLFDPCEERYVFVKYPAR